MKITINKKAEKVLKSVKKKMCCSDSTAIIMMSEIVTFLSQLHRR